MAARSLQLLFLVVAAGSMGGCPAATPPGESSGDEFSSVRTIHSEITNEGIVCARFEILEQDHPRLEEFARCYAADDEVDIWLFRDEKNRDLWLESLGQTIVVVGSNWFVTVGGRALARDLRDALGGEILDRRRQT